MFPDPARTIGLYVQTPGANDAKGTNFACIEDCTVAPSATEDSAEESKNKRAETTELSKFVMTVRPLSGQSSTEVFPATELKYLARAYLCNVNELSTEKMPATLVSALQKPPQSADNDTGGRTEDREAGGENEESAKQIVLIQTISIKANIASAAQGRTECCLSEGNSVHRLHALVAKETQADQFAFELYPVVFKAQIGRSAAKRSKVPLSLQAPEEA